MITLGEGIKKARSAKTLTQAALAELVGVLQSSISQYENNEQTPPTQVLARICLSLELSLDSMIIILANPPAPQPVTRSAR